MNRINDLSSIEERLLELAHTTDAKITAPALAYFAPCSVENAQRVLDDLSARGQLSMDVQDDGSIRYELLGRQRLHTPAPAVPVLRREAGTAAPLVRYERSDRSPLLAAVLAMWIPGAGHLYAGRAMAAFMWFLVIGLGYTLLLPGLVLHMFSIVSAAAAAQRGRLVLAPPAPRRYLPAPSY